MNKIQEKFKKLGIEHAPGQEANRKNSMEDVRGPKIHEELIDFSHGDVDAFLPIPSSLDYFEKGVSDGGNQAYTEYKGSREIRKHLADKIGKFINKDINSDTNIIITPGTQGALFLAISSIITKDDKVAIVQPDYFANRKIVEFLEGEIIPISLNYQNETRKSGLNIEELEDAFKSGVKLFVFSNPNNPTGVIYSSKEIKNIRELAKEYNVKVIADELYSRQVFDENHYEHLFTSDEVDTENIITIMGPSKTESLSGYRLGVAFGSEEIIKRMEKLQAIVSLRTAGYNQTVLKSWFTEPDNWLINRVKDHQNIRNDLVNKFRKSNSFKVRPTEAGSYLFPEIKNLNISVESLAEILQSQANVIVTPGTEFGEQFSNSFRINFSQDREKANEGADRIIEIVSRYTN